MTTVEIIAQCVGILGIIVFLLCFHFNSMKNVLKVKLLVDIIWGTHYFLLGAYSGFATNVVCSMREIVFMNNNKKFFKSTVWLYIFILFNIIGAMVTWRGFYSLIPCTTSILATISFWQKNVQRARIIGIANNVLMFTYDIFVASFTGMIGEALAFVSVLTAIMRNRHRI